MKKLLILEDQYTKKIYQELKTSGYTFPIVDNIHDPMEYKDIFNTVDVILLDNYFPWKNWGREVPLWCDVLEYIMSHDIKTPIVCISDYRRRLLDRYPIWEEAFSKGLIKWFPSKDAQSIKKILEEII